MPDAAERDRTARLGALARREFINLPMRALSVPEHALTHLGRGQGVRFVAPDRPIRGQALIGGTGGNIAVPVAARYGTSGAPAAGTANDAYDGTGIGIAVIDSGVGMHGDLSSSIVQYDFTSGQYFAPTIDRRGNLGKLSSQGRTDAFGHGTHVAGILAGSGANSNCGLHAGLATSAQLLSLRVLDGQGRGLASDAIAALDWLLSCGKYFKVRVVNLSLGKAVEESNALDPLVLAVERVWDAGMTVVVAAGNYGRDGNMTIASPANSRKVITVGSLTDGDTGGDFSDDYVSTYSSMGPTLTDHVLKPDLIAPGNRLISTIPASAKLRTDLPERLVACTSIGCTDAYFELSGTSMAAPMVAATDALMLQKSPALSPATIKARLMRSARKIDADPTAAGAGVLDINVALNATGVVYGQALSPLMARSEEGWVILVEDTALLWGDATWGAGYLWNNAVTDYTPLYDTRSSITTLNDD